MTYSNFFPPKIEERHDFGLLENDRIVIIVAAFI